MTQRSPKQQAAIEVYCRELANALNDAGYDMKKVMEVRTVDIPWSQELVKEALWKTVQEPMYPETADEDGHVSTAKLQTEQVDHVWKVLDRHISQNFGVSVPFPSIEEQRIESLIKEGET